MRAVTVRPGIANSVALSAVPDPSPSEGAVLVKALALGICGTDREIIAGLYGWAPPGADHLILGHESLGRVVEAPAGSGFAKGDLVAGIVRRPDPVPCSACAQGAWDNVPQRPIHRTRDQGAARLRLGAVSRRARLPARNRSEARPARRPARAGERGGESMGARAPHRHARACLAPA